MNGGFDNAGDGSAPSRAARPALRERLAFAGLCLVALLVVALTLAAVLLVDAGRVVAWWIGLCASFVALMAWSGRGRGA